MSAPRDTVTVVGIAQTVNGLLLPTTVVPALATSRRFPAEPGAVWVDPRSVTAPLAATVALAAPFTVAVPLVADVPSTETVTLPVPVRARLTLWLTRGGIRRTPIVAGVVDESTVPNVAAVTPAGAGGGLAGGVADGGGGGDPPAGALLADGAGGGAGTPTDAAGGTAWSIRLSVRGAAP